MSRYVILFLPVVFAVGAQLLIKAASFHPIRSSSWLLVIFFSVCCYLFAFVLYSNTVRHFSISIASPVNTLAVMLAVILAGVFLWGETLSFRQVVGILLGIVALFLLSYEG